MKPWQRIAIAATEALVVGLVTYYVMQPSKLTLVRAQVLHNLRRVAADLAETFGNAALALEVAYNDTVNK